MILFAMALASFLCEGGPGTIITRPPCAVVTNDFVRSESIPGSVCYSNAVKRLDDHAASSLYGTVEAMLERYLLPGLLDYGGARNKTFDDIANSDLCTTNYFESGQRVYGLRSNQWYGNFEFFTFNNLSYSTNRDYSVSGRRLRLVNDLIDNVVYGDGSDRNGSISFNSLEGLDTPCDWLDPTIDLEGQADGKWHLDDQLSTAKGWGRFLVSLSELVNTNLNIHPFRGVNPVCGWLIPSEMNGIEAYMDANGFPSVLSLFGDPYLEDDLHRTGSLRARRLHTLPDLISERCEGVEDVSSVSNRPSKRIWWERAAIANAVLSCCSRSIEHMGRSFPVVDGVDDRYTIHGGRAPRLNFRNRMFSGSVTAELSFELKDDSGIYFGKDQDTGKAYTVFYKEDWDEKGIVASNNVSISTNISEYFSSAWHDVSTSPVVKLLAYRGIEKSDLRILPPVSIGTGERTNLYVRVQKDEESGLPFFEFTFGIQYPPIIVGTYTPRFEDSKKWTGSISFSITRNLIGTDTPGDYAPFAGPTSFEHPGLTSDVIHTNSLPPFALSHMVFSSASNMDIYRFGTCVVNRDPLEIERVSEYGTYVNPGVGKDEFDPFSGRVIKEKDTWIYFLVKHDHYPILDNHSFFEATKHLYDNAIDYMVENSRSACPDLGSPTMEDALSMTSARMNGFIDEILQTNKLFVFESMQPQISKTSFDVEVSEDEDGHSYFKILTRAGTPTGDNTVLFSYTAGSLITPTYTGINSPAVQIGFEGCLVTDWNFKHMKLKE